MMAVPLVATRESFGLGEGPNWDPVGDSLIWVDISAGTVYRGLFNGDAIVIAERVQVDSTVGVAIPGPNGNVLVAGARSLFLIDQVGRVAPVGGPLPLPSSSRLNDGSCDPVGRFYVGSIALDDRHHGQVLLQIDRDGAASIVDDNLTLSNGIAWSPDGQVMYHVDTFARVIWRRDYELSTGSYSERSKFVEVDGGLPDGIDVDLEGCVWVAMYGAGQIRRYSAAGEWVASVSLPAPNTTCVSFAGPRLDRLVVSTARDGLDARQLALAPASGRLFVMDVDTPGSARATWAGF